MNLIGIKARKASENKINTKTKNKVLDHFAKLLDKEKKFITSWGTENDDRLDLHK